MGSLFYKPDDGWAADFIPFYHNGEFKLFYLKDWRNSAQLGEGTPWYLIGTRDFVHFTEYGEAIPRGTRDEQDLFVFTGSVFEADGLFHIFYTGHNYHFVEQGKPCQAIMHATSRDLLHWEKIPADTFYAPTDRYEPHDWRDPFVFRNGETGEYWMVLTARLKSSPVGRGGCTALCVSRNLTDWEVREPLWAPGLHDTHECPDLFRIGEWWYLLFSTYSDHNVTHYRMSRSLQGPWTAPANDTLDNRAFYAAKSWTDGSERYLFGWNATREGGSDTGAWQWGGNLVVHQLVQAADGALLVRPPESVERAFGAELPVTFGSGFGSGYGGRREIGGCGVVSLEAPDSFACAAIDCRPGTAFKLTATVVFADNTRGCGFMLRAGERFDHAYYVTFDPGAGRLKFERYPRSAPLGALEMFHLERPIVLTPGTPYAVKIFAEHAVCEVYVDDKLAMSARMYDLPEGACGVFVSEGAAEFSDVRLFARS